MEGMEYAGVKNTKIAVVEIMSGAGKYWIDKYQPYTLHFPLCKGHLGNTIVPNVSTIRSIQYYPRHMKVFKASSIGDGVSIPYKKINFETNMRLINSFRVPIKEKDSTIISRKWRRIYFFYVSIFSFWNVDEAMVIITSFLYVVWMNTQALLNLVKIWMYILQVIYIKSHHEIREWQMILLGIICLTLYDQQIFNPIRTWTQ